MRAFFLLLLLIGAASAQFEDVEGRLAVCEKNCCQGNGGYWDNGSMSCSIGETDPSYHAFASCDHACSEDAAGQIKSIGGGQSVCCAPAAVSLLLLGAVSIRRMRGGPI
jgi:hypothetical protein